MAAGRAGELGCQQQRLACATRDPGAGETCSLVLPVNASSAFFRGPAGGGWGWGSGGLCLEVFVHWEPCPEASRSSTWERGAHSLRLVKTSWSLASGRAPEMGGGLASPPQPPPPMLGQSPLGRAEASRAYLCRLGVAAVNDKRCVLIAF